MIRKEPLNRTLLLAFLLAFACSCKTTRLVPEGDSLYIGADVNIQDEHGERRYRKTVKRDLEGAIRPKENSKILGLRVQLGLYSLAGDTSKRGFFRNTLRKLGQPPVLASSFDLEENNETINGLLENRGYFFPKIESRTETKKRKTKAIFDVWTGPQYKIRNVEFPIDSSQISIDMAATKGNSLLQPGLPYNLDLIKGERARIDRVLSEKGYYYFKPDHIIVLTDTTVGNHQVDMHVRAKHEETSEEVYYVYRINNVFVYPNFRLTGDREDTLKENATFHNGFYLIDPNNTYKPRVFDQAMQFKPEEIYNRTEQNLALNRLVSLGTFKFVKNRFDPINNPVDPRLDVYYYLTPYPKKSLRLEVGVASQNDSRMGTQTRLSWRNRNALRGAELLTVSLHGGYEAQAGGNVKRPATFEGGAEVGLDVPRFLVPFFDVVPSSMFIPRTTIRAGYDISLRRALYRIHSARVRYGYTWKEDIRKEHLLFPVNVNYVRTDTLGVPTVGELNFSNLIFNGLIIGPSYEYTFNGQAAGLRRNNFYFNGLVDFSGNLLGLFQGASQQNRKEIFGIEYAQYMKMQVDGRYYRNYGAHKNDIWANRIIIGYGHPYGNSRQLPNIKQFFSGGASSLRGFRARLVGPGTFNERYINRDGAPGTETFIETLGDIKLEINTELRKHLYQFLNGAIFVDAGNIWLANEDPRFPGGKFTGNFYNELAVDAGFGLRFDFEILTVRLDLAWPIRKPWLEEGNRLVFDDFRPGEKDWRQDNLIFNLAIGYPF